MSGPRLLVLVVVLSVAGAGALTMMNFANAAFRKRSDERRLTALLATAPVAGEELDPPVYFTVEPFDVVDKDGQPFQVSALDGKVWIAYFFFTQCEGICPVMTSSMKKLEQRILDEGPGMEHVQLVSMSVDPTNDSPRVLRAYAKQHDAVADHWSFLTGDRELIWKTIGESFHLPVGEDDDPAMPIYHSGKLVLVDGSRRIRGYYSGLTQAGRDELWVDLHKMLSLPLPEPVADVAGSAPAMDLPDSNDVETEAETVAETEPGETFEPVNDQPLAVPVLEPALTPAD